MGWRKRINFPGEDKQKERIRRTREHESLRKFRYPSSGHKARYYLDVRLHKQIKIRNDKTYTQKNTWTLSQWHWGANPTTSTALPNFTNPKSCSHKEVRPHPKGEAVMVVVEWWTGGVIGSQIHQYNGGLLSSKKHPFSSTHGPRAPSRVQTFQIELTISTKILWK